LGITISDFIASVLNLDRPASVPTGNSGVSGD